MTKHGNIIIEPTLGGYYIFAINMPEDKIYVSESELHDLELCLFKLRGLEITESDKLWEKETKNFNN